jgi:hypothetical protein
VFTRESKTTGEGVPVIVGVEVIVGVFVVGDAVFEAGGVFVHVGTEVIVGVALGRGAVVLVGRIVAVSVVSRGCFAVWVPSARCSVNRIILQAVIRTMQAIEGMIQ